MIRTPAATPVELILHAFNSSSLINPESYIRRPGTGYVISAQL